MNNELSLDNCNFDFFAKEKKKIAIVKYEYKDLNRSL